jgi:hypothetical protein
MVSGVVIILGGLGIPVGLAALVGGIYLLVRAADPEKADRLPFTSAGGARVVGIVAVVLGVLIGCLPPIAMAVLMLLVR